VSENAILVMDGRELAFEAGETVLQVARRAGIEIPTLCDDPRLEPAGACRMCLVEIEGDRRMQPACAQPARADMVVRTTSENVQRNQRTLLALLRADTVGEAECADDIVPSELDAMIRARGDVAVLHGLENLRAGREGDPNHLIGFRPERCILCAKCVRYCDEIEGVSAITLSERGAETTIATVDGQHLADTSCELCGGCVSVCPTGAMVDLHALADGRPERELDAVRTTCNYCGVGCQLDLHVDAGEQRVVKVTPPEPGTTVNDGNLCVKGRFAIDFIHHPDRLTVPLVRDAGGELREASWEEALERAATGLRGVADRHGADAMGFISSSRCTGEENYLVQKLARAGFGTHNVHQCAAT
jgi:predicted molibdopterin-dependent oxidoreductase YjgC